MKRVATYLNNLGIACPLGITKQSVCETMLSDNAHVLTKYNHLNSDKSTWVGDVKLPLVEIPQNLNQYDCRNNRLLATAFQSIADDVKQLKKDYGADRIGVIIGTSTSGIAAGERALSAYYTSGEFTDTFNYLQQEIGTASVFLAEYAGLSGINYCISTACSSSGKAIAAADRLIQSGMCDAVIVGGSDSLCATTLNGFDTLQLISSDISNPFSHNRSGLNIGEGAALFILTKKPSKIKLSGYGESSDAYHPSTPDPSGAGAKLAINQALDQAKLNPKDIGYINLHGTGTIKNDEMESLVINNIFSQAVSCSSTKPLTGHTLGAAAAIELGLCWLLLSDYNQYRKLPKHFNDAQRDPNLAAINLVAENTNWEKPYFMSNSFAFGGSNVSLIIEKVQ